ncbi:MAG: hypothetical protein HFI82_06175 [Eubacterium sp.]|jgi:tetratricopeptide (TPR) repeat protein|nr:hypothetical protein [Eubacterium sp.]
MNFPIPVFFISSVVFVLFLAMKRGKQTRRQENTNEAFLERERQANATRKKDISNLNYLPYTADALLLDEDPDEELSQYVKILKDLSGRKMLNLSMYSNTDLKLMYGPANLNELSECDNNYHLLSDTLLNYAERENTLQRYEAAISILEYAMSLRIDSSRIYLMLARLYDEQNTPEKIQNIFHALSSMDDSFTSHVLPKLRSSHIEE